MILVILLSLFILVLGWLLIAPLRLSADSALGAIQLTWWGLGSAGLFLTHDDLTLRFRVFFWKKEVNPLQWAPSKKNKKKTKKKSKSRMPMSFRKIKRLLRTFTIRECRLDLDTDNYTLNAWLYPVLHFLNRHDRQLRINFEGRFYCRVVIENRGYRLLWALLQK